MLMRAGRWNDPPRRPCIQRPSPDGCDREHTYLQDNQRPPTGEPRRFNGFTAATRGAFGLNRDAAHASLETVPQDEPKAETEPTAANASGTDDEQLQAAMDAAEQAIDRAQNEVVTESLIKARQELEQVLAQTRGETENFRDKWLRAAADLENYRKRAAREREETLRYGNEKLLRDFLPLLDDLERAIDMSLKAAGENATLLDGVRLVHKKFISQLEKHGVATFETIGEAFDPTKHEAVQQAHGEQPAGVVMTQLQRGFMLNDRLLRPAMVVVSLGPSSSSEEEN